MFQGNVRGMYERNVWGNVCKEYLGVMSGKNIWKECLVECPWEYPGKCLGECLEGMSGGMFVGMSYTKHGTHCARNSSQSCSAGSLSCNNRSTHSASCLALDYTQTQVHCRVHIVGQWANQYIMVFHIAILYDIYLPGGSGQAMQTVDALVSYWWLAMMCGLWMCRLADTDPQNFQNPRTDVDNIA